MARVFVIDDDQIVRRLAGAILERGGHEVVSLEDGQAALKALEHSTPDMVVTDLMMPRMDGFELLRRLRADARWSELPVIVLTARLTPEDLKQAEQVKVRYVLTKPFTSAQLLNAVTATLQNPPAG
jgi:chemosensory pili system protein ChpA (sensor histidine kinase/response regulator)